MQFVKMQGAGNDYIYVDCFVEQPPADPSRTARLISDRHFGVGADGLVLIGPSAHADAAMRMFNADGSEAQMCGNAIRCVAKYLHDQGRVTHSPLTIETGRGNLTLELETRDGRVERVRVDMGEPLLEAAHIPTTLPGNPVVSQPLNVAGTALEVTCVSMGNPHCVVFVDDITDDLVLGLGPRIEHDPHFPERVNVEFVEVLSRSELRQRTWERGSGETLACGTGAAAVCVAGVLTKRSDRRVLIHLSGGDLDLHWEQASGHVFKTGPAVEVFTGVWTGC